MASFSPQRVLVSLSPATSRRLFQKFDPSFVADWKDDDPVFAPDLASSAYLKLTSSRQDALCLALRDIVAVADSSHGLGTLRESLLRKHAALPAAVSGDNRDREVAALVFLGHPDVWKEASFFVKTENVPERDWYDFVVEAPDADVISDPTKERIEQLADAISQTWSRSFCGLGRHIEFKYRIRSGSVEYYLAEVTTFARDMREFLNGKFVSRVSTEVRHIAFIFDRKTKTLRVGTSVPFVQVPSLAQHWGRCIKGVRLVPAAGENMETVLEMLGEPKPAFTPDERGYIEKVRRTMLCVRLVGEDGDTYEANSLHGDAYEKLRAFAKEKNLREGGFSIDSAMLEITVAIPGGERRPVLVSIRKNRWTVLTRRIPSWIHGLIRERLVEWGLVRATAA